jgi:acyl-CoA dehydrogenase
LLHSEDAEACERYLPRIADGSLTATFAHADTVTAEHSGGRWKLNGAADFVLDGEHAELILVRARTPDGDRIFAWESTQDGCRRTPRRVLDQTRRQALLEFQDAPAAPVGAFAEATMDTARAALAAEQVGGIAHALEATVSYVGQRKQFGRAIGSFQAVKHRLADLLVESEAARSVAAYATACVATASPGLPVAASAAATVCSAAYQRAVAEYVQLHGGIGFTWEHPAHLYVRRARSAEVLFGDRDFHHARLAGLVGVG